ncbi:hypothetical protein [Nocardioides acrostichi]|uniref:AAA+ ATPase domain-containing protein n=1 Tax=Nocardioides acrostichi TaxID=2784339 RepID=A0A930UY15_9ACTN|nr:hypothetical protein [Nocardioides acrostichi]MBF4160110.1 hypothetical protein [Nocardioides acrostichi]
MNVVQMPVDADARLLNRAYELEQIERAVSQGTTTMVSGGAGVGVTTTLGAAASHARAAGRRVVTIAASAWARSNISQLEPLLLLVDGSDLVVVDDVHRLQPPTVDALGMALTDLGATLLVGTHGQAGSLFERAENEHVGLAGLDRAAVALLVSEAFGREMGPSDPLVAAFHRATNGRPSALRAHLDDPDVREAVSGMRVPDPGMIVQAAARVLPERVQHQVARLDGEQQIALAIVALGGETVPANLLEVAAGVDQMRACAEIGLLRRADYGGYRFRQGSVREMITMSVAPQVRSAASKRLVEAADALGYHLRPSEIERYATWY